MTMTVKIKIGIWGFGREGQSVFNHLKTNDPSNNVTILVDDNDAIQSDTNILHGDKAIQTIQSGGFDIIYKSPGISLYRPEIKKAKENGTQISSATNLWFENNPNTKKIIVTGTKGKSTTSSLLYHVMKQLGLSVALGGNIGVPLLDLKEQTDFTILELSSYQLADLQYGPDIFVALNLFPEHLEWHQTHQNYYNDKLSPIHLATTKTIIANANNQTLKDKMTEADHPVEWFYPNDYGQIKTQLKGEHNQNNITAVIKICEALDLNVQDAIATIQDFEPLPHRLQEFQSETGNTCVNDSISTTPESTIEALKVYQNRNSILILGGTERGQNYSQMIDYIKSIKVQTILLLPENGNRLIHELGQANLSCEIVQKSSLDQACKWIKNNQNPDNVIILSPAAPSYGQFTNFEERGNRFIQLMT